MKRFAIGIIVLMVSISSYGQYVRGDKDSTAKAHAKQDSTRSRFSFGGNFAFQFGAVTIAGISPLVNYRVTKQLYIGAGPIYQYFSFDIQGYAPYSTNIYGGRVVGLYYLPERLSNIFLMGEYDLLSVPYYDYFAEANSRTTIGIPLGGIGYRMPVGTRSYITVAGLWDFSHSALSPYTNPVFLVGFDVGI